MDVTNHVQGWWHFYIAPVQMYEAGVVDPCVFSKSFAKHDMGRKKETAAGKAKLLK